jgi:hypothetical protein
VHDGREKLVRTLSSQEVIAFDVKLIVPPTAGPGETKTVRMTVALTGDRTVSSAVELSGHLP